MVPDNAEAIDQPLPILWVNGSSDTIAKGSDYAFDLAPDHVTSLFTTVGANHFYYKHLRGLMLLHGVLMPNEVVNPARIHSLGHPTLYFGCRLPQR